MDRRWYREAIGFGRHDRYADGMSRHGRRDCRNDGDRAVPIPDIVLNNDRWPGFPNFLALGRIKFNEVDFTPSGKGHERFDLTDFFDPRGPACVSQASSS